MIKLEFSARNNASTNVHSARAISFLKGQGWHVVDHSAVVKMRKSAHNPIQFRNDRPLDKGQIAEIARQVNLKPKQLLDIIG